jgi:autotransporter-associated beta strand protein
VCRLALAVACAVAAVGTAARGLAVDYTWGSATTGGSWTVTTNWDPNGAPTSGDTATLANATANRTVFYNSAASGSLTGLTFTQTTSGILNELRVQRNLAVTNALVLGASSGTAQLTLAGTSAANITGTFSGGITVNSGGVLSLANVNPAGSAGVINANLTGNVTVSGGRLDFSWIREGTGTSSANQNQLLTGNLTMSSGTIAFDNPLGSSPDRRLQITGDVSITGGSITTTATSGVSNIRFDGASTVFAPASYDSARFQLNLQRTGDQTYTGSTAIQVLIMRGTGIKTVSNSGTISTLQMMDADGTGRSATTLKLGSNLTAGSGGLVRAGFSDAGTTFDYGVNADIYTLDLTAASGAWTPTTATGTISQWALTGTAGRIIANGFNLATANVGTTVGPGLILESRAGNSVANTLSLGTSGTGAIDATSVFRYAGAAAVATPSTLTSSRAIGDLEVTSGALQLGSTFTSMQNVRVSGGSLDLGSKSLTVPGVRLTGGTITTGSLTSSGTFDMQAGTISAALLGTGTLTKSGAGLVVLSGSNSYSGGTVIDSGTLQVGAGSTTGWLPTSPSITGSSGGVLAFNRSDDYGGSFGTSIGGGLGVAVRGSGTLTLSGSNGYTGTTTLSGGILALGGTNALAGGGNVTFSGGRLQYSASNGADLSGRIVSSGSAISIDTAGQDVTWASGLAATNQGGLTKSGSGRLTLSANNSYTGLTTISGGTLQVGNGSTTGSVGGDIANNAALVFNRSNDLTQSGAISGTGSLTKQGNATLSLTAANTYTGLTTISAGTLALSGGDNRLATTGTVTFSGNGGLSVSGSQALNAITLPASSAIVATLSGGGTVALAGSSFTIAPTANVSQLVDATGLSAFSYANAAGTFKVAPIFNGGAPAARLALPATAAIRAASVSLGTDTNNGGLSTGTLALGTTTTISADTITLGGAQAQGVITASGATNPVLTLRGTDGTSAVGTLKIGTSVGYGLAATSRIDLAGGVSGTSTLDARVTNLIIGEQTRSGSFSQSGTFAGALSMQSGTLTATTITLGQTLNSITNSIGSQQISGSLSVAGGVVNVNTLYLANQNWSYAGSTVSGAFTLGGGGTLNAGTIASGTGAGTAPTVRTFAWNDGTIANLDASTDLSIGSGITFTLASTGARRFSISAGRSGTVASVLTGAGGLTKIGTGRLLLDAANSYAGSTTIAEGTLALGALGSLANSSSIIVGNAGSSGAVLDLTAKTGSFDIGAGQTLGGGGTVQLASSGTLNVLGLLSPGNSPGLLTFDAGTTVLSGTTLMEISGLTRATDPSHGTGFYDAINVVDSGVLTFGGLLELAFSQEFANDDTFNLFAASGGGSLAGNFTGVNVTGSFYTGLTWSQSGTKWTSTATTGGQTLEFNATSGQLVIVPEPGALALAGIGVAAAAWAARRRRNTM